MPKTITQSIYTIDELMLPEFGEGMFLHGVAELVECDDWFRVADIKIGRVWLQRPNHDGGGNMQQRLFKAISDVLERDEDVAREWTSSTDELRYDRSEGDVYSALAGE